MADLYDYLDEKSESEKKNYVFADFTYIVLEEVSVDR